MGACAYMRGYGTVSGGGMRLSPDVSADSVRVAWSNVVRFMAREDTDPLRYVAVGYDEYGRLLEMVAVLDESDRWHVFHAMRATPKVLRELKLL